jgi:hypothetical protein
MNNTKNDLDEIEDELKQEALEEDLTSHKVSGHSVFELERIIAQKSQEKTEEKDDTQK